MSYMYKYQDLVSGHAESFLDNGNGDVDQATFVQWWFAPIEKIRPEMGGPVIEPEEPKAD
jgi:hypothetical protein